MFVCAKKIQQQQRTKMREINYRSLTKERPWAQHMGWADALLSDYGNGSPSADQGLSTTKHNNHHIMLSPGW